MNFKKIYFLLFFLSSISFTVLAQNDTVGLKTIVAREVKLANLHPVEKVYLHFDKPYYAVGDTIWFKAYVTIDIHQPSPLSRIVYVDMINSRDSIVQSLKLQVTGSIALGDIILQPGMYRQDNYHIRAYTNWMRNDDAAYFFNKTIPVGSTGNQIITAISLSGTTKGNTAKVIAKVAYKDATGKPYAGKKVSWRVVNDEDNIVKGKGVTDANGFLNVVFNTNKPAQIPTSALVTEINVTDEKSIGSSFSLTHAIEQPDVQFFPESGDMVSGIRSKIAFKAVKPNGLGVEIKGNVTDNSGAVVAEFASQHLGMGVFALQPEAGKSYKANITFPDGSQTSVNLPAVKAEGITLNVYNTDPDNLSIKLTANPAFFQKYQNKLFYILGQSGEIVCFAAQTPLQNNSYSALISKSKFPSGVVKFTLISDHGESLAERITFVKRDDLLNITMKSAQTTYAPRQKVILNVAAQKGGQPSEANLSMTVIDESKVPFDENSEITILTNLLLTSEIKGYIEKPNYYFNQPTDKTAVDLDILMLTQGYRRFSLADIIAQKLPPKNFLPELGLTVSGTIRNSTGLPIPRGNVTLIVGDKKSSMNSTANIVGEFKFTNLVVPDSTKITVNARNNPNANNLMILIDNNAFQPATPNINAPDGITTIDSTMSAYLKISKQKETNSHVLKEVVITAKTAEKKPSHEDYPELLGLSMLADQTIKGESLSACTFIAQCLMGGTLGLTYVDNNLIVSKSYMQSDKRPVQIYYNGMAVDWNYLNSVASADVESIEVFLTDGLSGINKMNNTNGVLVINGKKVKKVQMSKADILALLAPQYSAQSILLRGYSQASAFYAPRYDPAKPASSFGSDLRSTIYWNPKVITDKTGAAIIDFFNADAKGSYRAIIEGFDSNGNIGRFVYHYKVQ